MSDLAVGKNRNPHLDVVRIIAVTLVLGRHVEFFPADENNFFVQTVFLWRRAGWIGVDIFFVLSGFLVSGLIFREYQRKNSFSAKNFLIRRGFKIYPAFYFFLFITFLIDVINVWRGALAAIDWRSYLKEIVFLQNYSGRRWEHTWSLAVEEHFYFALAATTWFLLWRFSRARTRQDDDPFRAIPSIFVFVAIFCLTARIIIWLTTNFNFSLYYYRTHLRIDSLMMGVFLSYLYYFGRIKIAERVRRQRFSLIVLGIVLLSPSLIFELEKSPWLNVFGFTLFYCGAAAITLGFNELGQTSSRLYLFLAYLGANSYTIYLCHVPIEMWAAWTVGNQMTTLTGWGIYLTLYVAGAMLAGCVFSALVERPTLILRERFFPAKA